MADIPRFDATDAPTAAAQLPGQVIPKDAKGHKGSLFVIPVLLPAGDVLKAAAMGETPGGLTSFVPLPGHYGSGFHWPRFANWWHDDGDGIVDYPLTLTSVTVEQRRQIVYVNEMADASPEPVCLSDLMALYGDPQVVDDWEQPNVPKPIPGHYTKQD